MTPSSFPTSGLNKPPLVQVAERCKEFAKMYTDVIWHSRSLRRCFVSHMMMLWEYGLMSAQEIDGSLLALEEPP